MQTHCLFRLNNLLRHNISRYVDTRNGCKKLYKYFTSLLLSYTYGMDHSWVWLTVQLKCMLCEMGRINYSPKACYFCMAAPLMVIPFILYFCCHTVESVRGNIFSSITFKTVCLRFIEFPGGNIKYSRKRVFCDSSSLLFLYFSKCVKSFYWKVL